VDEQEMENIEDNTQPILEDQDETMTGVENEQDMENTHNNTQSIP